MIASAMRNEMTLPYPMPRGHRSPAGTVPDRRRALCQRLPVPAVRVEVRPSPVRRLLGTPLRKARQACEEGRTRTCPPDNEGSGFLVHNGLPPPLTTVAVLYTLPDRRLTRLGATPAGTLNPQGGAGRGREQPGTLRPAGRRPRLRRWYRAVADSLSTARQRVHETIHWAARTRTARSRTDLRGSAVGKPKFELGPAHTSTAPCWPSGDYAAQQLGVPADPSWAGLTDCLPVAVGRRPAAVDAGGRAVCQPSTSDSPTRFQFGLDMHRAVLAAQRPVRDLARVARDTASTYVHMRVMQGSRIGGAIR